MYEYCKVAESTNVGRVRKENEDWLGHFECENGLVTVVCDGMGGHVGGKVASHVAVEAIETFLKNQYFDDPRTAIGMAIDAANKAILQRAAEQPELRGMGSTCVMIIVRDGKVYLGSVGDSRIYLIRKGSPIIQLTEDQSFVQELVNRGLITAEEAEHHPRKNEITNALGIDGMKPATVRPDAIIPEAGDCFLLCSDGLSGMVSNKHIERVVRQQAEFTTQQRVDLLINDALEAGGLDNVTVQILEFAVSPNETLSPIPKINWKRMAMLSAGTIALLAVCWLGFSQILKSCQSENVVEVVNTEQINLGTIKVKKLTDVKVELRALQHSTEIHISNTNPKSSNEEKVEKIDCALPLDSLQILVNANDILKTEDGQDKVILTYSDRAFTNDSLKFSLANDTVKYIFTLYIENSEIPEVTSTPNEATEEVLPTGTNTSQAGQVPGSKHRASGNSGGSAGSAGSAGSGGSASSSSSGDGGATASQVDNVRNDGGNNKSQDPTVAKPDTVNRSGKNPK